MIELPLRWRLERLTLSVVVPVVLGVVRTGLRVIAWMRLILANVMTRVTSAARLVVIPLLIGRGSWRTIHVGAVVTMRILTRATLLWGLLIGKISVARETMVRIASVSHLLIIALRRMRQVI